jgi:hypothetical protein
MANTFKAMRRVVTGNDAQGRSKVLWDSAAPNVKPSAHHPTSGMVEIWAWEASPAPLSGERDDGRMPFHQHAPAQGGYLRMVGSAARPADYDPARDPLAEPIRETRERPGGWDRGGLNAFSSPIHKTATVDYGLVTEGERTLILDSGDLVMKKGDVVVQLGNWHGWSNPDADSMMAFVMMGASFAE